MVCQYSARHLRNAKAIRGAVRYYCPLMMSDLRFQDFEDLLAAAGSMADAARPHGSYAARSARCPLRDAGLLNESCPTGASVRGIGAMIERVFTRPPRPSASRGWSSNPCLPDDEQPLNGRASALALWCTGFLYGLGAGQISDLEALNGEVGEIVRDFTEISARRATIRRPMNPTNRRTRSSSSSSASRPRSCSRSYFHCADRRIRPRSSGCTDRPAWTPRSSCAAAGSSCA